ncbi:MAG: lipoprotein insertase outer membrane protein LolB [Gammaproteobacteria bacterium]
MNSRGAPRSIARAAALLAFSLLLTACATQPLVIDDPDWLRHEQSVAALQDWELSGRLVVRQADGNDSVNINWQQLDDTFDLRLFGSLGLGAVRVYGTPRAVTVEKAGEESVTLPGLAAVTREYFGYEFPTAELLYWVRGLPAPRRGGMHTFDDNRMLATLRQEDANGKQWELSFDRYQPLDGAAAMTYLPGRITARSEDGLELRFLISRWSVPAP